MPFSPNEGQLYYITAATQDRVPCLAEPATAGILLSAFEFYRTSKGLRICAWTIMPDHFHILAALPPEHDMGDLIAGYKSWTSHHLIDLWLKEGRQDLVRRFTLEEPRR